MTRSHAFLILLLLSIVTLILLSGCASENKVQYNVSAIPSNMSETVNNSGEDANTAPAEVPNQEETEVQPVVTMTIWSYDVDKEFAYTLAPEDSSRVIALFEGAEKEVHDTPLSMGVSMSFRWGRDYMSTAPEYLDMLDGDLNGESTLLTLDEKACIELRQIITKYANPDMPNEWPNAPSAGAE